MAAFIWLKAGSLSIIMAKDFGEEDQMETQTEETISKSEMMTVVMIGIGLYLVLTSFSGILRELFNYWYIYYQSYNMKDYSGLNKYLIQSIIELILGILLILDRVSNIKFIEKLKR